MRLELLYKRPQGDSSFFQPCENVRSLGPGKRNSTGQL